MLKADPNARKGIGVLAPGTKDNQRKYTFIGTHIKKEKAVSFFILFILSTIPENRNLQNRKRKSDSLLVESVFQKKCLQQCAVKNKNN